MAATFEYGVRSHWFAGGISHPLMFKSGTRRIVPKDLGLPFRQGV